MEHPYKSRTYVVIILIVFLYNNVAEKAPAEYVQACLPRPATKRNCVVYYTFHHMK